VATLLEVFLRYSTLVVVIYEMGFIGVSVCLRWEYTSDSQVSKCPQVHDRTRNINLDPASRTKDTQPIRPPMMNDMVL